MKTRIPNPRTAALTLVEVLVVIVMLAVLVMMLVPAVDKTRPNAYGINCVNDLKQVGLAYWIWAGDNNGKYPIELSVTNGGTMEFAASGDVVKTFQIMSNELSTPRVLYCPADLQRTNAANFESLTVKNISYFVGLDAATNHPQMFLSGDDNFAIGGVPVKSGLLEFSTNAAITWTAQRHKNAGNIGFADGSVAQTSSPDLRQMLMKTGVATNRLAIP